MKIRNESLVQNVRRSLELIAKRFSTPPPSPDCRITLLGPLILDETRDCFCPVIKGSGHF